VLLPPLVEARLRPRQQGLRVEPGQLPVLQAAPPLLGRLPREVTALGAENNPEASTPSVRLTGTSFPGERTDGPATCMWRAAEWTFIMDWPEADA
jgi:hypothetical protein